MTTQSPTAVSAVARLFWMMFGPMAMFVAMFLIASNGGGWFTVADMVFLTLLGGLVLARWVEFRGGNAQTSTGEPATAEQLRRYAVGTVIVGLLVWVVANIVGNHW